MREKLPSYESFNITATSAICAEAYAALYNLGSMIRASAEHNNGEIWDSGMNVLLQVGLFAITVYLIAEIESDYD